MSFFFVHPAKKINIFEKPSPSRIVPAYLLNISKEISRTHGRSVQVQENALVALPLFVNDAHSLLDSEVYLSLLPFYNFKLFANAALCGAGFVHECLLKQPLIADSRKIENRAAGRRQ